MVDNEWQFDANALEDRALIDGLLPTRAVRAVAAGGDPCPLHQEREQLIWAFADGALEAAEEDAAWDEIERCPYCLRRLIAAETVLRAAEVRLETEVEIVEPASEKIWKWIISVFAGARRVPATSEAASPLAVAAFEPTSLMGEPREIRQGRLDYAWNDLHLTVEVKMEIESQQIPVWLTVSVVLVDPAGVPVESKPIDLCDIEGELMETHITDRDGRASFTSREGGRFARGAAPDTEIGFALGLRHQQELGRWDICMRPEDLEASAVP